MSNCICVSELDVLWFVVDRMMIAVSAMSVRVFRRFVTIYLCLKYLFEVDHVNNGISALYVGSSFFSRSLFILYINLKNT